MPLIRKPAGATAASAPSSEVEVLKALGSGEADERWAAARAAFAFPGAAGALATAVRCEVDSRVREAMFTSLARMASPESIDAMLAFLRSDDAALRAGALDALRSQAQAVRVHLPGLLNDEDSDVRLLSCELARTLPGDEATRVLSDLLLREKEANVCAAAIDVLAEAGRPEALPALAQCEARFSSTQFLTFAIKIARRRILSQSTPRHD
jgi:hypothetical protein